MKVIQEMAITTKRQKLEKLPDDKKLEVIYQWVKQNHITLAEFKVLVSPFEFHVGQPEQQRGGTIT
mgnify:CR=1 FL=1